MCGVLVGPFPEFFFSGQGIPSGGKRIWSVWSVIEKKKVLAVAHTTLRCLFLYDMFSPSD